MDQNRIKSAKNIRKTYYLLRREDTKLDFANLADRSRRVRELVTEHVARERGWKREKMRRNSPSNEQMRDPDIDSSK